MYKLHSNGHFAGREYESTDERYEMIPSKFEILSIYPNPFNPVVTIPYALPNSSDVKITIYNLLGQRVTTLIDKKVQAGYHNVLWDSRSRTGVPVASGIYFVKMEAGKFNKTKKIVLLK
ncbi:T9SS type A sorting domain-containing protein [Calditrichota bacterium]